MKIEKVIILTFILTILSCQKKSNLEIRDLDFSNINQPSILKNGIKKTYLIAGSDYTYALKKKGDTLGLHEYNSFGYLIKKHVYQGFGSYYINREYDSLNLVIKKNHYTDFNAEFNYNYEFIADSLILYKKYDLTDYKLNARAYPKISGRFEFNEKGLILNKSQYQDNDYRTGKSYITTYSYNSKDQLISEKITLDLNRIPEGMDEYGFYKSNISYNYIEGNIQSANIKHHYKSRGRGELIDIKKVFYDNKGLVIKEILQDSLIILHKHVK
jgi:hypothetical protein